MIDAESAGQLTRETIEKAHRLIVSRLPSKPHPWPEMDVGNPMHGFCDRDGVYHPAPGYNVIGKNL